jgi:hypothetical protein
MKVNRLIGVLGVAAIYAIASGCESKSVSDQSVSTGEPLGIVGPQAITPVAGTCTYTMPVKCETVTIPKVTPVSGTCTYTLPVKCETVVTDAGTVDAGKVDAGTDAGKVDAGGGNVPVIAGCQMYPADNPWNRDISKDPVHPNSSTFINVIGANTGLHPDFGSELLYGIPFNIVPGNQPRVPMTFLYDEESDPGPYPIPPNPLIEGGPNAGADTDRHILVLDKDNCKLYETWNTLPDGNGWKAGSGAIFDLKTNALRPDGMTSADAAGLPVLPGLVRYEEIQAGVINHAIRFTARNTQKGYIHPATHQAGYNDNTYPPMGLRLRMKANYDISRLTGASKIIAVAMKKYGIILADNGGNWYFSGTSDTRFNDDELNQLKNVTGSAFEAVQSGPIIRTSFAKKPDSHKIVK